MHPMFGIIALMILTHTAYSGTRLSLSLTALAWHLPTALIGVLLSLISVIPMFISLSIGRWIDRVGTFIPFAVGSFMLVVGCVLPGIVEQTTALFLSSALTGTGFLLCHMSGQQMTGLLDIAPDSRTRHFGWLAVGFSISGFLGPMIAGFVIDYVGYHWAFVTVAAIALLAMLMGIAWKSNIQYGASNHANQKAAQNVTSPSISAQSTLDRPTRRGLGLLLHPDLSRLYLCVVLISSAWDVHQFLVPIHASKLGISASEIGLIMGSFALATLVIRLCLPFLHQRISNFTILASVLFVAFFCYAVYPLLSSVLGMMLISFVLGLGLGCGQPIVMAALFELSPKGQSGEASGLRQSLINATQTALPTLFGSAGSLLSVLSGFTGATWFGAMVARGTVFTPLFWLFSVAALAGGIATLQTSKNRR